MKRVVAVLFALAVAGPAVAQRRVDLVFDVEGVRSAKSSSSSRMSSATSPSSPTAEVWEAE